MNSFILIILGLAFFSCNASHNRSLNTDLPISTMTTENKDSLITKLMEDHYGDFFNYMVHDKIISAIWAEAAGVPRLKAIVIDEQAPTKARLLACEVLLQNEFTFLRDEDVNLESVAGVYATALANNTTGMANSWGLLYEYNDEGPIGTTLVLLGEKSIPALRLLLDNQQQYLYHGSKEATVGNAYQFQIRDFAAYYICKIKNIKAVYHQTREARDAEIERLKVLLQKDK